MKKYLHLIAIVAVLGIGAVLGGSALSTSAQSTWTAAPGTPPACPPTTPGCNAPINVGAAAQVKTGLLTLGQFMFNPTGTSNVPVGSVLTAIDSNGTVGWRMPNTTQSFTETFNTSGSWTAPSGLTGSALVKLWGAGAGGNSSCLGGSGGAGGYGELSFSPVVGTQYNFTVGVGGRGKHGFDNGSGGGAPPQTGTDVAEAGGNTIFNNIYIAYGGNPPSAGGAAGTGGSTSANLTNAHVGGNGATGNNQYGGLPWGWVGAQTRDPLLYAPAGGGGSGTDDGNQACDGQNGFSGGVGQISITYSKSN